MSVNEAGRGGLKRRRRRNRRSLLGFFFYFSTFFLVSRLPCFIYRSVAAWFARVAAAGKLPPSQTWTLLCFLPFFSFKESENPPPPLPLIYFLSPTRMRKADRNSLSAAKRWNLGVSFYASLFRGVNSNFAHFNFKERIEKDRATADKKLDSIRPNMSVQVREKLIFL